MTANMKAGVLLAVLAFATLAAWGAHELLRAALEPVMRGLGS